MRQTPPRAATLNEAVALAAQLARFALVGLAATGIHIAVYLTLVTVQDVPPWTANLLAYGVSFAVSFTGHLRWTFGAQRDAGGSTVRSLGRFVIAATAGLCLNAGFVEATLALRLAPGWAAVPMVFVTPILTFAINKFWVFAGAGVSRPPSQYVVRSQ